MIKMSLAREIKLKIKSILGWLRCMKSGVKYSKGTYVGKEVHFVNGKNIKMGQGVQIRPYVDLFAGGGPFVIGDNCDIGTRNRIAGNVVFEESVLLGPDNYLSSTDHVFADVRVPIMDQGAYTPNRFGHEELRIGEGSWIGTHVAIVGAIHIGKHCVIGANSVVIKDIPDYCVVVGNPAKIVKKYSFETNSWEKVNKELL